MGRKFTPYLMGKAQLVYAALRAEIRAAIVA